MRADLRAEIRQVKPFRDLSEEAFLSVVRTADRLDQALAALLRDFDLTPTQYNVLRILRGAGATGLSAGEIGGRMISRSCDVTRLIDRLEAQGLVSRSRLPADRRVVLAMITPAGLERVAESEAPIAELQRFGIGRLGPIKLRMLVSLLEEVPRSGPDGDPTSSLPGASEEDGAITAGTHTNPDHHR